MTNNKLAICKIGKSLGKIKKNQFPLIVINFISIQNIFIAKYKFNITVYRI